MTCFRTETFLRIDFCDKFPTEKFALDFVIVFTLATYFAEQSSVLLPRSRPRGRRVSRDRKRSASASPDIGRCEFPPYVGTT